MNRRGILARSLVSSPAIMLAVGLASMAPGQAMHDVLQVAAQRSDSAGRPLTAGPMRGPLPHEVDPTAAPTPASVAVAPGSGPGPAPPKASPARPLAAGTGRFAYGYCTWWVASRRPIPWTGNAWQWWGNARALGMAEGSTSRPGAIMVMGISRSSPQGHVAYVESVNADGTFTVSEMNWWGVPGGGWGRVDYRRVATLAGVIGFIY